MNEEEEPRRVLVHPALVPALEQWLAVRGLEMRRTPEPGLWLITPTDETLRDAP